MTIPQSDLLPPEAFAGISDPKRRAAAQFLEATRVLLHPRCINCHPAGDSPLQGDFGFVHEPPVARGPENRGVAGMRCDGCHQEDNVSLARVPGAPNWHLAPLSMAWVGKSPAELARDIEKVLAEYVRSPTVNVIVANAASALSQIKVVGEVKAPQSMPYRDGLRVLDVVLVAGGVTDFAAPNRAKIVRAAANNQKPKEDRVRLGDLLRKGDMSQNLALGPGDVLVVPQARF